ncbi:MAG: hypothetical protein SGPRY_003131, partial [Prymnesium sp.]
MVRSEESSSRLLLRVEHQGEVSLCRQNEVLREEQILDLFYQALRSSDEEDADVLSSSGFVIIAR